MSLVATTTLTHTNATDAAFRLWGAAIGVKLAAAGWIQTADTGQINWTTVLAPLGATTVVGYEIWRMDDALQATAPVYLKLEYGSGSAAANPAIWITIGSGSTGTGVLSGLVSTRFTCTGSAAAAQSNYWSGDTNRFLMILNTGTNANCFGMVIQRTTDVDGLDTDEGVLIHGRSAGAIFQQYWNHAIGPAVMETATVGVLTPTTAFISGVSGNKLTVYPCFWTKQGGSFFQLPGRDMLFYFAPDMTALSPVTLNHLGSLKVYLPLGATFTTPARTQSVMPMIRYE
jgi:hypothetical protein